MGGEGSAGDPPEEAAPVGGGGVAEGGVVSDGDPNGGRISSPLFIGIIFSLFKVYQN